jgi:hypothetical protein
MGGFALIPEVVDIVKLPVKAAGGIADALPPSLKSQIGNPAGFFRTAGILPALLRLQR